MVIAFKEIAMHRLTPLIALLLLVHELGHYVAARAFRRPVRMVAIGFGPKLIERVDRRDTT